MPFSHEERRVKPNEKSATDNEAPNPTRPFSTTVRRCIVDQSNLDQVLVRQELDICDADGLSIARMDFLINPASQAVTKQSSPYVAPWATEELRPWLDQAKVDYPLTTIGKTIGRYCDVASLRYQCWSFCRKEYPQMSVQGADLSSQSPNQIGQSIKLARSSTELEILWRISIQEDGDIRSVISPRSTIPRTWASYDPGNDLVRIEEAFTSLLRERGVTEAIRAMTRILFPP